MAAALATEQGKVLEEAVMRPAMAQAPKAMFPAAEPTLAVEPTQSQALVRAQEVPAMAAVLATEQGKVLVRMEEERPYPAVPTA